MIKGLYRFLRYLTILPSILGISLVVGMVSAFYFVKHCSNFEAFSVGVWRTYPLLGSEEADPYSRAHLHETGLVPLGQAEGLQFEANYDSQGTLLNSAYRYRLEGNVPEASFFTLYAADENDQPFQEEGQKPFKLSSFRLWKNSEKGDFCITLASHAQPGNWLALPEKSKNFKLILTLYNSSLLTNGSLQNHTMPSLIKLTEAGGCYE